MAPQSFQYIRAVDFGEIDVQEHEIRTGWATGLSDALDKRESLRAVPHNMERMLDAMRFECLLNQQHIAPVILGQENIQQRSSPFSRGSEK
jgi:hypothetical protein